jgi:predicted neutral ceramidase superfamily lipid hydrolase
MKIAVLMLALTLPTTVYADSELKAGVARVEITPSTLMRMYGYANRKCGPANGTHDPLFAKALVLDSGGSRLAIVTMDVGSMVSENLRREVASKLNIPVLLLSAQSSSC